MAQTGEDSVYRETIHRNTFSMDLLHGTCRTGPLHLAIEAASTDNSSQTPLRNLPLWARPLLGSSKCFRACWHVLSQ